MARVWEWLLDGGETRVDASISAFGHITIRVNERAVQGARSGIGLKSTSFAVPGGEAQLRYGSQLGVRYRCELRVGGQLLLPVRAPKGAPTALGACPRCGAALGAGDRFCEACGEALPSPEQAIQLSDVRQANSVIGGLSLLFLISGFAMYVSERSVADEALKKIAAYDADTPLAEPIPGVAAATFGELRSQIEWEATSVLIVNLVLAAIMCGLWRWGKRKPGAAIIVAFCTYLVVQVTNAALDPRTLAQGWVLKFIIIVYLLGGMKAALALRQAPDRA